MVDGIALYVKYKSKFFLICIQSVYSPDGDVTQIEPQAASQVKVLSEGQFEHDHDHLVNLFKGARSLDDVQGIIKQYFSELSVVYGCEHSQDPHRKACPSLERLVAAMIESELTFKDKNSEETSPLKVFNKLKNRFEKTNQDWPLLHEKLEALRFTIVWQVVLDKIRLFKLNKNEDESQSLFYKVCNRFGEAFKLNDFFPDMISAIDERINALGSDGAENEAYHNFYIKLKEFIKKQAVTNRPRVVFYSFYRSCYQLFFYSAKQEGVLDGLKNLDGFYSSDLALKEFQALSGTLFHPYPKEINILEQDIYFVDFFCFNA